MKNESLLYSEITYTLQVTPVKVHKLGRLY